MNRRNFMAMILAAGSAPAFVRAGSIMRVNPRIVVPPFGVSIHHEGIDFRLAPCGSPGPDGWQLHSAIVRGYTACAWVRPGATQTSQPSCAGVSEVSRRSQIHFR